MRPINWASPAALRACADWNLAEADRAQYNYKRATSNDMRRYYSNLSARCNDQAESLLARAEQMEYTA